MDTKGISKLDLKRRNRRQILLAIRQAGMLARVDIAAQLSLTRAAVTIITNQMIAQNILEDLNSPVAEAPDAPKKKGRKKTMIRINPSFKYAIGAVISEQGISIGISNLAGEITAQTYKAMEPDMAQDDIVAYIVSACRELMKKKHLSSKNVLGLGVGIIPSRWTQFRAEWVENEVTFKKLSYVLEIELSVPVLITSAITLYALANIDYSNPDNKREVLIYSGERFHSVLISDQTVVGGLGADTSMIDRVVVSRGGTAAEGYPDGSVHAELTRPSLLEKVTAAKGETLTMEQVSAAYLSGDATVIEVINEQLDKLATLIYNLCTTHDASTVILQSFQLDRAAFARLEEQVLLLTGEQNKITIRYSDIDGEKAFLAGCALAQERQFYDLGGMVPGEQNA